MALRNLRGMRPVLPRDRALPEPPSSAAVPLARHAAVLLAMLPVLVRPVAAGPVIADSQADFSRRTTPP